MSTGIKAMNKMTIVHQLLLHIWMRSLFTLIVVLNLRRMLIVVLYEPK
jgi:hypothetical protein